MKVAAVILLACCAATGFEAAAVSPEVFSPGVISGPAHDSAPTFTPDGKTVYFQRSSNEGATILESRRRDTDWSEPRIAPFSGAWSDLEPSLSPDGTFLVFISNRPAAIGGKPLDGHYNGQVQPHGGGNLWRVDRKGSGWGEPVRLPDTVNRSDSTFATSVVADGSIYFMQPSPTTGKFQLYRSQFLDGGYQAPQSLSFSTGTSTTNDVDPAVAPDESFIVFGSGRAPAKDMDLFIVKREGAEWGTPRHLGDEVNAVGSDAEPRLGPDHRTLYFSSERTVPVTFPRAHEDAVRDLARIQAWDNGQYNIWRTSLAPWLEATPIAP